MKLSDLTAKLTSGTRSIHGKAVRVLAATVLAGAAFTAAVPAAQAQRFAVGVQFGGPRYVAPLPPPRVVVAGPGFGYGYGPAFYGGGYGAGYAPGYWEHRRFEDWRAHEYWDHHRGYWGRR